METKPKKNLRYEYCAIIRVPEQNTLILVHIITERKKIVSVMNRKYEDLTRCNVPESERRHFGYLYLFSSSSNDMHCSLLR